MLLNLLPFFNNSIIVSANNIIKTENCVCTKIKILFTNTLKNNVLTFIKSITFIRRF